MTREEAIKVLNMVEAHGIADEAKRVAIEALSADTVSRESWNDVTEEYVNTVNAILAVMSAPSCLKEVSDIVSNINTSVVRCKDCKWWLDNIGYYSVSYCPWNDDIIPDADDYCSYGERKE